MTEFRVLVPLDGSALSEGALAYLPLLGALGDLRVRLLSVAEPKHGGGFSGQESAEVIQAYALRQELHLKGAGLAVESVLRSGVPSLVIVNEADDFQADLILMSTHARAGMERWRLGSVTEKVARLTYHDVLVVPPAESPPEPRAIRNLLVPLDGSEEAENALDAARHWARALGARLHLAQAVTLATLTHDGASLRSGSQLSASRSYLERQQGRPGMPETEVAVLFASPEQALSDYSREHNIDLIAGTAHGSGSGSRVGLGRVAEHLLRGDRAVLLLRSWEAGDLTARRRHDQAV